MRCDMYDFKNNAYERYVNKPGRAMRYANNFQPQSAISARKSYLVEFIQIACQTIFVLALFSVFFLLFANLPQIFEWLTNVLIGVFEFVFKLVEFLFSLAYLAVFFFLFGIFIK